MNNLLVVKAKTRHCIACV